MNELIKATDILNLNVDNFSERNINLKNSEYFYRLIKDHTKSHGLTTALKYNISADKSKDMPTLFILCAIDKVIKFKLCEISSETMKLISKIEGTAGPLKDTCKEAGEFIDNFRDSFHSYCFKKARDI